MKPKRLRRLIAAVALAMTLGFLMPLSSPAPSAAAADPLPEQSDQPAPPTRDKLVLDHGHIDAFTPIVDDGSLRLMLKEDVTALNTLRNPEDVAMHVKPAALDQLPSGFIQGMPRDVYHLPLIQDQNLIWPGWETQLIQEQFPNADTNIVVVSIDGPGEVFLWSQGSFNELRSLLLGGGYELPATISQPYPAHTHAAWAFTEPGIYTMQVRADVRASNGNTASTETGEYVFVVGDLGLETTTELSADVTETGPGDAITFTATVEAEAAQQTVDGAVQFRDRTSGAILGHTPVGDDGTASFRTGALPPGEREIVAEFVPTWSYAYTPSHSDPLLVNVLGDLIPAPEGDDTTPVSGEDIDTAVAGEGVVVTGPDKRVAPGSIVTARVSDDALHGDWVSVWLHGEPSWLGWAQVDLAGNFTANIPGEQPQGDYSLVVKDRDGEFIGYDRLAIGEQQGGGSKPPPTIPTPPPEPEPVAPPHECLPPVTLEYGHIDAFTVSAGGGAAVLQILEDVTGHRVLREVETVLLRVREQAHTSIPAGVPGGPSGYVLPLAQNQSLIWPGWDTNRTTASGYTDVSIYVTSVQGPGTVSLYTSRGAFGGWAPILEHGGYELPGEIREPSPAHTHAQWVFSERGIYQLNAYAIARNPSTGESLTTRSHTYVFQVGDAPLGDVFCSLSAHGSGDSAFVNAAVHQAAAEAVAAEQAENAKLDDEKVEHATSLAAMRASMAYSGEGGSALGHVSPGVLAAVIGSGVLVLAGIAGGTVWMLRRMREPLPQ